MTGSFFKLPFFRLLAAGFSLLLLLSACGDMTATSAPSATTAAGTAAQTAGNNSNQTAAPPVIERKIIRNATITMQVEDMEAALDQLRGLATAKGGYVLQENTTQQGERPNGVMVLQVPAGQYESTITGIRQLAFKVDRQESTAQDVTEEFIDLQSEINNFKVTEEGLQKLIDKAQKLDEILALQKELTSVRGEIEKRQGRLNFIDNRTAFSTITVNLSLKALPAVAAAPRESLFNETWQPGKTVNDAWTASLKLLGGLTTIVLQVLVFSWWYLPFLITGIIWWWVRRARQPKDRQFQELAGEKFPPTE
jgi:hypothetical protein